MAIGIDIFKERFANYSDQYTIIGGMACELLMNEAALDFRATRDIDMVLIVEALTNDFANEFWDFIKDGGYECWSRKDATPTFYRFVNPKAGNYPYMIELFARPENSIQFEYKGHLAPVHFDDDISSLSAILLNEEYYSFLLSGRKMAGGISVLDALHIIPLKMRAWLDLQRQKAESNHVNEKDIRKHKQDVFRLYPLIDTNARIQVPDLVYSDIQMFIDEIAKSNFDLKSIHMPYDKNDILSEYRSIYQKTT